MESKGGFVKLSTSRNGFSISGVLLMVFKIIIHYEIK